MPLQSTRRQLGALKCRTKKDDSASILAGRARAFARNWIFDQMAAQIPLGRVGDPDEIAKAAVFLASSDSSFVNGAELFVDGGMAQI